MSSTPHAHPPETLEGWYALHQIYQLEPGAHASLVHPQSAVFSEPPVGGGWSAAARLIGSQSDLLLIHFRATLDGIAAVQAKLRHEPWIRHAALSYSFLSVTEAGMYQSTAALVREAEARRGVAGDDAYQAAAKTRLDAERNNPHVQRRLYPELPANMPYVCFYPMSKRRVPDQNWYALPLEERSRMMREHGLTGRRYAGRISQIITGAIGFEAWEWGVTLFAADPLDIKKLVSEMRFDEVSAQYAEFGDFYVGKVGMLAEVLAG